MNHKGSASRGELTKAMGATIQTVRKHETQIQAMLEGIKQLMDGQAALGEEFKTLRQAVQAQCIHDYRYDIQADVTKCGICGLSVNAFGVAVEAHG